MNLIIVGKTGTGKTTLVDSFINFLLGIEFYDQFRYRLIDEEDILAKKTGEMKQKGWFKQEGKD